MPKFYLNRNSRDGVYYVLYTGSDGKRKRKSLKTKKRKEAEEKIRLIDRPADLNYFGTTNSRPYLSISLNEFAIKILTYVQSNYTNGTYLLYKTAFMHLIRLLGKNRSLYDITINDIEAYKNEHIKRLAPPTLNKYIKYLSAAFNLGIKWKILNENPAKGISKLKELQREKSTFEPEELHRLIETIEQSEIKTLVWFGYYTGCRLSELLNLQWKDVDLKRNVITIRNKANFKTKTGKIRKIPISSRLLNVIEGILFTCDENYIFKTSTGKPYTKDYAGEIVRKAIRKAGLPHYLHFHCLRHTFITELLRKGVSIYFVSRLAGHSNISTTMTYIHTDTEDYRKAINLL